MLDQNLRCALLPYREKKQGEFLDGVQAIVADDEGTFPSGGPYHSRHSCACVPFPLQPTLAVYRWVFQSNHHHDGNFWDGRRNKP